MIPFAITEKSTGDNYICFANFADNNFLITNVVTKEINNIDSIILCNDYTFKAICWGGE